MDEKYKILKVTIEEQYYIPIFEDEEGNEKTKINGWSLKQVIKNWLQNFSLDSYHATRDSHRIGGSRTYIRSEVIENKEG